jgi:glycosyltransferase involved in cell wall biosynthesis
MRILHFLNHIRILNGHVNVAVDLACAQADAGETVGLASGGGGYFESLLGAHRVELLQIEASRRPSALVKALARLKCAVSTFQPDIVHSHMVTSTVLASLLRPFFRFKLVTTVHNEFEKSAVLMGLGDRVVTVSEACAASMERRGVPRKKLRVVLNGPLGSPRLSSPAPPTQPLDRPAIAFLGGLHPRKGVDILIEAFGRAAPKIPSARLYLIGSGPFRAAYEEQAARGGCADRIIFVGPRNDPRPWLQGADLLVLPSRAEPAGLVLAEAREAGCAIIASNVGGIPEMLDGGRAGILVPPERPDLLAEALVRVLRDPAVLAEWQEKARQGVERFQVNRMVRDYLSLYREVLTPAR